MRYTIKVHLKRSKALLNALYTLSENNCLEKEFGIIARFIRDTESNGSGYYEVSFLSEQDYLMFLLKWA
jgi:hypothetical protein